VKEVNEEQRRARAAEDAEIRAAWRQKVREKYSAYRQQGLEKYRAYREAAPERERQRLERQRNKEAESERQREAGEKPVVDIGGPTTHGLGHATMYGRLRLYNDRLEFDKRATHAVIPVSQISGVSTSGLMTRKIRVFSKMGDVVELESPYLFKRDYERLRAAIQRLQAGS
jgi:hypothetical protein